MRTIVSAGSVYRLGERGKRSAKTTAKKKELARLYLNHYAKADLIELIISSLSAKALQLLFTEAIKYRNAGGTL